MPALLGFVGFIVYIFWTSKRPGDDLLKGIMNKLRVDPNLDPKVYAGMTPARLRDAVASDERVRTKVNREDMEVLTLLVNSHFKLNLLMFLACVALVSLTVYLFRTDPFRPKPTVISQVSLGSGDERSKGILVDVFPVVVRWQATGKEQFVDVVLENVATGKRTPPKKILSSSRLITFSGDELVPVLQSRQHGGINSVRAVVNSLEDSSHSETEMLYVGVKVSLAVGQTLISPDQGEHPNVNFLSATIDNSSDSLPKQYSIEVQLIGQYWNGVDFVQILKVGENAGLVEVRDLGKIQWSEPYKLKYIGPDDPRKILSVVEGVAGLMYPAKSPSLDSR